MTARWLLPLLLVPAVQAGCLFPDVTLDDASGTGATGSSTGGDPTPSSVGPGSTSTAGGEGGGSSSGSTTGGGSTSNGGGGSTGDGGGGGSAGPGGDGFCDDGCQYLPVDIGQGGAGGSGGASGAGGEDPVLADDCDGDLDPNGSDCQPCDPEVSQFQTEFSAVPYLDEDANEQWDWNCDDILQQDRVYTSDECADGNPVTCDGDVVFVAPLAECGKPAQQQTCGVDLLDGCFAESTAGLTVMCR